MKLINAFFIVCVCALFALTGCEITSSGKTAPEDKTADEGSPPFGDVDALSSDPDFDGSFESIPGLLANAELVKTIISKVVINESFQTKIEWLTGADGDIGGTPCSFIDGIDCFHSGGKVACVAYHISVGKIQHHKVMLALLQFRYNCRR